MKTHSFKTSSPLLLPLLICSFFTLGLLQSNKAYAETAQQQPPMPVQVERVEPKNFAYQTEYPAQLAASQAVGVHARVTGTIEKQFYLEGSLIKAGEPLYKIDDRRYQATKNQAEARLKSAKVQVQQNKVNYDRVKSLRAKQSVSDQDVDDAFTAWQTAIADVDAAQAALLSAQIELDDTIIKAEIGGIIGQRQKDVGDLINPLNGDSLLNHITQTDPIHAHFAIADGDRQALLKWVDAGLVKAYATPKVSMLTMSGQKPQAGTVDFIDAQLDLKTASQAVRAAFTNPEQRLLPGQFVRLNVQLGEWQQLLSVPEKAIMQVGGQSFVYLAEDGKAQMKPVQLAGQVDGRWLIKSGLNAGDAVIIGNLIKLRPNSPVQILTAEATAPAGGN
ncbi:MAG: efflux RND transporter periplasmic adaptor subunit [Thiotrichales bacterium]|nr:efflux RND transporter periplasmic adaptor subunit [Thiotrichales bacterium]